jgi:NAD(P)-dependent dehydrogenase (short-subunit alcohol dehydrogenase family)
MKDFAGRFAVITGGGTGIGRELARQLAGEGCNVAMCDVSAANMAVTKGLCETDAPRGTRITTFVADVSDEAAMHAFRRAVATDQGTDRIHLLFNNAGVGGRGGGFVNDDREEWERTFAICWGGVYNGCRAFLPMLMAADEGHIINTSSVFGFWASLGAHTAYVAAKFAVKGFTEALITDLRLNAPHIKCSVVMPGHIGTEIVVNSRKILIGEESESPGAEAIAQARVQLARQGMDTASMSDDQIKDVMAEFARRVRDDAPTTAADAARIILDGVRAERWRILVGDDAHTLDSMVRADPETVYEPEFSTALAEKSGSRIGG